MDFKSGTVYKAKRVDGVMVILETDDGRNRILTDLVGVKSYRNIHGNSMEKNLWKRKLQGRTVHSRPDGLGKVFPALRCYSFKMGGGEDGGVIFLGRITRKRGRIH
ncbi:MAG: hypothetical protein A2169_00445 [Deltaproteobacteria bacterium RBG_13_47_9]|nr:MAG: hypothetical protein A2169_00445 [Deltaproteobacteria bacterium RBG_13_47_9]